jgi:hypothetical protein
MRRTLGPSTVTIGGLLEHLALGEDHYFTQQLLGRDYPAIWAPMAENPDWDWNSAGSHSPEALRTLWSEAVAWSEAAVGEALADGGLDRPLAVSDWDEAPNLRRMLVDLVEEYARHTGHADLIRESIDGFVGEDAPGVASRHSKHRLTGPERPSCAPSVCYCAAGARRSGSRSPRSTPTRRSWSTSRRRSPVPSPTGSSTASTYDHPIDSGDPLPYLANAG